MKKLDEIIYTSFLQDADIEISQAKLDKYLLTTKSIALSNAEKLRRLAIQLENETLSEGWLGLNRIYQLAVKEDSGDLCVFKSWAISLLQLFQYEKVSKSNNKELKSIADEALKAIEDAISLAPNDAECWYIKGLIIYYFPDTSSSRTDSINISETCFKRTLSLRPEHEMARLYLGHCYTDNKNWNQAINTYELVNQERLFAQNPYMQWRCYKLQEEICYCYAMIGNTEKLISELNVFLKELEKLSDNKAFDLIVNLNELLEIYNMEIIPPNLKERVKNQLKRFDEL